MKWTYLLINFCTIIVPFIFSFHPKIRFDRKFKGVIAASSFTAVIFILWDSYFTGQGIWGFNSNYLIGLKLGNLPFEEILFFICIPFSCLFTYYCINLFYDLRLKSEIEHLIVLIIVILSIIIIYNYTYRLYTFFTFVSLSILLLIFKYVLQVKWLGKLLIIYPVLLIPFFIVNGILTGTGIEEPVVWYNDAENMGIRLMTIPIEDLFYGFELILVNVLLFELFNNKLRT